MHSFYGGKQGRTYNIVKRFDEIYLNTSDYPSYDQSEQLFSEGTKFNYQGNIYLVLSVEEDRTAAGTITDASIQEQEDSTKKKDNLISIKMPDDIGTKVIELKGMVNEFQKGGSYTEVNYGQYVIIDTILNENHKSDDINGCLYRRGFDFTEAVSTKNRPSKAEKEQRSFNYEITIEDEQGIHTEVRTYKELVLKYHDYELITDEDGQVIIFDDNDGNPKLNDLGFNSVRWNAAWRAYIQTPGGGAIYVGQIVGPQGNAPQLHLKDWNAFLEAGYAYKPTDKLKLLDYPGMQVQEKDGKTIINFNDNIEAVYYNLRDKDDNVEGAVLAFKFPRTVFRITGQSISPYGETITHTDIEGYEDEVEYTGEYDQTKKQIVYNNLIHRHTKKQEHLHPFYEDWQVAIPKGIKGDSTTKIDITSGSDQYFYSQIKNYDASTEGASTTQKIGPYRVIKSITAGHPNNDQTAAASSLKIAYTQGTGSTIGLKNVSSLSLDENNKLKVVYSIYENGDKYSEPEEIGSVDTIAQIMLQGDNILVRYSDSNHDYTGKNTIDIQNITWQILGTTGSAYHIYGSYQSASDLPPQGFPENAAGWVATVKQGDVTALYAYDYDPNHPNEWYKVYQFDSIVNPDNFIKTSDQSNFNQVLNNINTNGIIFMTSVGHDDI